MEKQRIMRMVEAKAVALFFIQAVRVLFSVLFGVIYDAIFEGPITLGAVIIMLLVVMAFLAPLCAPRRAPRWFALVAAALVFLARIPLTLNDPQVRLGSSLLIVAAGGLYFASFLREHADAFPRAFIAALALDQLLRAAGNTFDITLRGGWLPLQVAISGALLLLSVYIARLPRREVAPSGIGFLGGLAIGAFLFLQTSLLSLPNAIARWSAWNYAALTPLLMLVTLLPLPLYGQSGWQWLQDKAHLWGWLLVVMACAGLASGFGGDGLPAALALLMAQWAVLVAFNSILRVRQSGRDRIGLHLALGFLCFLVINFAHAFTFTYAYTLDLFRGAGLPVFLIAGLFATLPAALRGLHLPQLPTWPGKWWLVGAMVCMVALSVVFARPPTLQMKEAGPNVRIGTYNIHYGYDTHWKFSLEDMARTIEASGADIVALQEVDAARITSYCVDDALWLSRRLRMGILYLPTMEHLTGIALLHRLPVAQTQGKLLTSRLEQTGIIRARLQIGAKPLDAYATWLGLEPEERAVQIAEALDFVTTGPAVFGGDLNSTPDSPVYQRMTQAGFVDPFIAGGFEPALTDPAEVPTKRIDFVWMRGLTPTGAQVLASTASDHRMVVVEARLE